MQPDKSQMIEQILLINPHPIMIVGMVTTLSQKLPNAVFFRVQNAESAATVLSSTTIHLIISPALVSGQNVSLLKSKWDSYQGKWLVISDRTDTWNHTRFKKAGFNGVLGDIASPNDFQKAVLKVLHADLSFFYASKSKQIETDSNGLLDRLTNAEKVVLEKIGQNMSSDQIARTLFISVNTVYNHRSNIIKKLNISGRHGLIHFAHQIKE